MLIYNNRAFCVAIFFEPMSKFDTSVWKVNNYVHIFNDATDYTVSFAATNGEYVIFIWGTFNYVFKYLKNFIVICSCSHCFVNLKTLLEYHIHLHLATQSHESYFQKQIRLSYPLVLRCSFSS